MTLNVKMHIRNPYKEKIDFEYLSNKYEIFRNVTNRSDKGKLVFDFKNSQNQQALSWCILKEDFDLDVIIPINKLIPTIPLRLNYILWIEDIFQSQNLNGIDIGCGATCIYPLLGAKKNGWNFLSTESNLENYNIATENVNKNQLEDQIKVVLANEESKLSELILDHSYILDVSDNNGKTAVFDFLMCNPPFFDSPNGSGFKRRRNYSTADIRERSFPDRGEIGFVETVIIETSLVLREKVRVYSTMLGQKSSLKVLINILKRNMIRNIATTEFCQGNTMRWGLAWSFDENLQFPSSNNMKQSFSFNIKNSSINWGAVISKIDDILIELEAIVVKSFKCDKEKMYELIFQKNTWSHQRKRKREMKRKLELVEDKFDEKDNAKNSKLDVPNKEGKNFDCIEYGMASNDNSLQTDKCISPESSSHAKLETNSNENIDSTKLNINAIKQFDNKAILKCKLQIAEISDLIVFKFIESNNIDNLHCLFQLFRNRFSV